MTTETQDEIDHAQNETDHRQLCLDADKCGAMAAVVELETNLTGTPYEYELNNIYMEFITKLVPRWVSMGRQLESWNKPLSEVLARFILTGSDLRSAKTLSSENLEESMCEATEIWKDTYEVCKPYLTCYKYYFLELAELDGYEEALKERLLKSYGNYANKYSKKDRYTLIEAFRGRLSCYIDLIADHQETVLLDIVHSIKHMEGQYIDLVKNTFYECSPNMLHAIRLDAVEKIDEECVEWFKKHSNS